MLFYVLYSAKCQTKRKLVVLIRIMLMIIRLINDSNNDIVIILIIINSLCRVIQSATTL